MRQQGLLRGHGSRGAKTTRFSVTVEQEQADGVEAIAKDMKVSTGWVIREAIDVYLAKHKSTKARSS